MLYRTSLVIYDSAADAILLDKTDGFGGLPRAEVAVPSSGMVGPVNAAVRQRFGLDVITMRYVPTRPREGDWVDAVFFMETRDPSAGRLSDASWIDRNELRKVRFNSVDTGAHVARFMTEVSGAGDVHPLRAAWTKPGWFGEPAAWIEMTLRRAGYTPSGRVEQVRHWNISSIARVPTVRGDVWFKAVPAFFAHEGALMQLLGASSKHVPRVIDAETARGTTLMEAFSPHVTDVPKMADALKALARLQMEWVHGTDELLAIGCPDRRIETLPAEMQRLVQREDVRRRVDARQLPELDAAVTDVPARCAELADCAVPQTLLHGDFHRGNVATSGGRTMLVDWTDGCVSHPFFDLATALPDDGVDRETLVSAYLETWEEAVPMPRLQDAFAIAESLACLHHAVSYQRILDGLEPAERWELGDEVRRWLERFLNKQKFELRRRDG